MFTSIMAIVGGLIAVIAALKTLRLKQQQALLQDYTRQTQARGVKEGNMPYIPVNQYSLQGSSGATSPASSHTHPVAVFWFVIFLILALLSMFGGIASVDTASGFLMIPGMIGFFVCLMLGITFMTCLKVADQWDRVIILRLGKFQRVQGPGMFVLLPFLDTVAKWIDTRVQTGDLTAEETLTKDTVPVDVDAVMFWFVYDSQKAALEVENFQAAVTWAAQTALRDLIGKTMLAELLVGRDVLDARLQEIIDERTEPWGVTVQSVEIREIKIPGPLQDAMSRQAQAERERQARVILGESEMQIAQSFAEAAKQYEHNPTALHLRAMNMLFEGLKEKGSLMIIPSSALDTMNLGAMGGLATLGEKASGQPMV
jgi:regulator of protease activity HflC (stomatin/prohibitin superfamily)